MSVLLLREESCEFSMDDIANRRYTFFDAALTNTRRVISRGRHATIILIQLLYLRLAQK
jgi:hypothetical protein